MAEPSYCIELAQSEVVVVLNALGIAADSMSDTPSDVERFEFFMELKEKITCFTGVDISNPKAMDY